MTREEVESLSDSDLALQVGVALGDNHYFLMGEYEKRQKKYPITREQQEEFLLNHRTRFDDSESPPVPD